MWNTLHGHLQDLPDNRQRKVFRKFPDSLQATAKVSSQATLDQPQLTVVSRRLLLVSMVGLLSVRLSGLKGDRLRKLLAASSKSISGFMVLTIYAVHIVSCIALFLIRFTQVCTSFSSAHSNTSAPLLELHGVLL